MVSTWFSSKSPHEKAEEARLEHAAEIKAEADRLAGDNSVEALAAAVETLSDEARTIQGNLPVLQAMVTVDEKKHGPAFDAAKQRLQDLTLMRGDFERSLRAAREHRGSEMGGAFLKAKTTHAAVANVVESWAKNLETVAVLANLFEDASKAGAAPQSMPVLPPLKMVELGEFCRWVASLKRMNIDPTGGLSPAIRARLELGR